MLTSYQLFKLKRLVIKFANAQEVYSWRGGGDPADIPAKEQAYRQAKKELQAFYKTLKQPPKQPDELIKLRRMLESDPDPVCPKCSTVPCMCGDPIVYAKDMDPQPGDDVPVDPSKPDGVLWGQLFGRKPKQQL